MWSIAIRMVIAGVGFALILFVVVLGFQAEQDPNLFIWFALAAAVLPTVGLALISNAYRAGEAQKLNRLYKVGEIEEKMQEAESTEERLEWLNKQRDNMAQAVRIEAERETLKYRKTALEADGTRVLRELGDVDKELEELGIELTTNPAAEQANQLRERLDAKDKGRLILRIGKRQLFFPQGMFSLLPMGDMLGQALVEMVNGINAWSKRRKNRSR